MLLCPARCYLIATHQVDPLNAEQDADVGWNTWDPEEEGQAGANYGVGFGYHDDDTFHAYFREEDRVTVGARPFLRLHGVGGKPKWGGGGGGSVGECLVHRVCG